MADLKPMRWFFQTLLMLMGTTTVTLALILGLVFLEDEPILGVSAPPSPEDVATTRQLVRNIRAAADNDTILRTDEEQLNSAIRLGSRFINDFRGHVSVREQAVQVKTSMPVPWWTGKKWLNVSGRVPGFDKRFSLSQVSVGATDVPPALALFLARVGANFTIGNQFGDEVLNAASAMNITDGALTFSLSLDDVGKNEVMRGLFGAMRGQQMPSYDEIENYHLLIRAAMAEGALQQTGSFVPYLQFVLAAVLERSTAETLPNNYTAAIFGLTKVCGARDFAMIVGQLGFVETKAPRSWATNCNEVTLNGRIDSRRHFITSAALQAASNTGVAVSIGEFKELYDTISGSGGFDFTDMAANLSGIQMSNTFMNASSNVWSNLLDKLETENDVIVPFYGIPELMPEAEFKARFGDVENVRYKEMLAQIKAEIDKLNLHRP